VTQLWATFYKRKNESFVTKSNGDIRNKSLQLKGIGDIIKESFVSKKKWKHN